MKKLLFALILLSSFFLCSAGCFAQSSAQIRINITDKTGSPVSNITKEDLSLFEEKTRLEINALESQAEKPCAALILIDNSVSLERMLPFIKKFAVSFVQNGLRKDDLVAVARFSNTFDGLKPFTNKFSEAIPVIENIKLDIPTGYLGGGIVSGSPKQKPAVNPQGATGLWDTLSWIGKSDFGGTGDRRKFVILLTDGVDTSSSAKMQEAADSLGKAGISVYAVGIGDDFYNGVNKTDLKKIAAATGGKEFFPEKENDFSPVIEKLKQRLASEYALTFAMGAKSQDKPGKLKLLITSADKDKQAYEVSYPQRYQVK